MHMAFFTYTTLAQLAQLVVTGLQLMEEGHERQHLASFSHSYTHWRFCIQSHFTYLFLVMETVYGTWFEWKKEEG
ncbi:hypothetical protein B0H65DRAFT_454414 [Neurospora tetraspora]|uniref:Uncharacterized protein n=1 Tax=Neurospora tetraspora TaxID=94610 RepID=A0AAE0JRC0_9PEZI|nr:hypothetical protein B0H65DRAFT_454414 [Neurospora tetraspora]